MIEERAIRLDSIYPNFDTVYDECVDRLHLFSLVFTDGIGLIWNEWIPRECVQKLKSFR